MLGFTVKKESDVAGRNRYVGKRFYKTLGIVIRDFSTCQLGSTGQHRISSYIIAAQI